MKTFEAMGAWLEARWAETNHDERAFPGLAARAIDESPDLPALSPDEIVDWALARPRLPPQFDVRSTFGEPPLTLYASGQFVIDVYFWLDGATATHQHGFSGAFHVLAGSSLHTRSRWTLGERINANFLLGELQLDGVELLGRGATRRIDAGDALIHALFHLDRPSVSLVVRTCSDALGPQYTYLAPGVAYNAAHADVTASRKRELLAMLRRSGHREWRDKTLRLLAGCELPLAFHVLLDTLHHVRRVDDLEEFLAVTRARHGDRVDRLVPVLAEAVRQREIAEVRAHVRGADHRLLLALLHDAHDRAAVASVIRQRCPARPPEDCIVQWLAEIAAQWTGARGRRLFGVPLDDASLSVLDGLLRGRSDSELFDERAREDATGEQMAELFDLCHAFRSSPLLGRLLA